MSRKVRNASEADPRQKRAMSTARQIPFRWVVRDSKWDDIPDPPVRIVPVIVFPQPDGSYGEVMVDSSPQIMRIEAEFSGRSIVPTDGRDAARWAPDNPAAVTQPCEGSKERDEVDFGNARARRSSGPVLAGGRGTGVELQRSEWSRRRAVPKVPI